MEPTVRDGDYLLVERLSIVRGRMKKGDIVVAGQPRRSSSFSHVLKRIKAVGGEEITFWDDNRWSVVTREVPPKHVWLEGDNSVHSLDSRNYGPVPSSRLEYRVLCRLWPLSHFGRLAPLLPNDPVLSSASLVNRNGVPIEVLPDFLCVDAHDR